MQFHLLPSFRYRCMWSSPKSKSKWLLWKISYDMWGVLLPPFPSFLNNPNCISLAYTFHMHQSQISNLQIWFNIWHASMCEVNPLIKEEVYLKGQLWNLNTLKTVQSELCVFMNSVYLICIYYTCFTIRHQHLILMHVTRSALELQASFI